MQSYQDFGKVLEEERRKTKKSLIRNARKRESHQENPKKEREDLEKAAPEKQGEVKGRKTNNFPAVGGCINVGTARPPKEEKRGVTLSEAE